MTDNAADPVPRPQSAAGAYRRRTAPAARCGAGALPVHPRPGGGGAGSGAGAILRRAALRRRQLRHRRAADRADGGRDRAAATRCSCRPSPIPRPPRCRWCSARRRCSSTSIRAPSRSTPRICEQRIAQVRAAGTLRPRAIIGVDLFGQPADWPALRAIAAREGLFTLDDLAQSFGATLHGRGSARRPTRPRPASSPRSRSAPTATAARCSPRATSAPRCIAACARTARAPPATRCCAPA